MLGGSDHYYSHYKDGKSEVQVGQCDSPTMVQPIIRRDGIWTQPPLTPYDAMIL